MNRLEQFKVIKQKYESLRDQYFMTRNSHHFMKFQQAFKTYCSFIDQHNIAPSEIEKFILTDVEECKKIVKKVKEDAILMKPSVRQMQNLASQQKILDCLGDKGRFLYPCRNILSFSRQHFSGKTLSLPVAWARTC